MSARSWVLRGRAVLLAFVAGCSVDPYCLVCPDAGSRDAALDAFDGGNAQREDGGPTPLDAGEDAEPGDGCLSGELCNALDDDCDGRIDEGVDTSRDLEHCGMCGRRCAPPHAFGRCEGGECRIERCDVEFLDLDGDPANGCEYRCLAVAMDDAVCDFRDDDCDGRVDEDVDVAHDPSNCGRCGRVCRAPHATAECRAGECVLGTCEDGFHDVDGVITNGCEYACVPAEPPAEACNLRDDDCDGTTDEGNPGGGAPCGIDEGECTIGRIECVRGALACVGAVGPTTERCNALDDDCDGRVDEGNPEAGLPCGTDVGRCTPGIQECRAGTVVCVGSVDPVAETCDGTDEDCDGRVDEGNPGGGAACGEDTGECSPGSITCRAGVLVCEGAVGPRAETCNARDDDCDGRVDEDFDLSRDVRHCGSCGNVCSFPNAVPECSMGTCRIASCRPGFIDLDRVASNGCEYACTVAGTEICNGRDEDCDGRIDEGLTPPATFCNPNGVCAGTTATCGGVSGWVCRYPSSYQSTETRCDSLDNDCDGRVDEAFPTVGTSRSNGVGICRRTGRYECNAAGDGVVCNAPPAGTPSDESCNGLDDDCDGLVDEPGTDDPRTSWRDAIDLSAIPHVTFTSGGRTVRIMQYEASRPDATSSSAGTMSHVACSRPDVVPWTSVTWDEAQAACCALNPGGLCPAPGSSGWRLCDAADWQVACRGPSGSCGWSYASMCASSQPLVCNGQEHDCDPALAGDQDCLYNTGSSTFPNCYTDWGGGSRLFDMSGNVKEWTATAVSPGIYQVRGGSYQTIEAGRACTFDFTVADHTFSSNNMGFRCCLY